MQHTKNQWRDLLYPAFALSLPLLVLAMLFYYRPFWGLMDDSTNLTIVDAMKEEGIFPVWKRLAFTDLFSHGRLRSLYYATVAFIYLPAGDSSVTAFTINIIFLSAIFFVSAYAFWYAARDAFGVNGKRLFTFAFITLCFAYPWTVYAIRAPSVQEKIVLLCASLVLLAQYKFDKRSLASWAAILTLTIGISINTKETIALFFPLFLAAQLHLDHARRSYSRTGLLLGLLLASSGVIKWAGTFGTYKAAYGMERAMQTLVNSKSLYLFLLLALVASVVAIFDYRRHRELTRLFLATSFPAGLLLFLVLMIPWGLGGYLNCSATVFVVMCSIGIFKFARDRLSFLKASPIALFTGAAYAVAVGVLLVRLGTDYSAYADLRRVIYSDELEAASRENKTLWMPCSEGAGTVEHYLKRFRGYKLLTRMPETNPELASSPGQLWLTSPGNCSGPENTDAWISRGEAETVIAPGLKGGYTLVRRLKAP